MIAGEDDLPSIADLSEMAVNIISKGETIERNGWKLSATIDQKNDSVTFKVKNKENGYEAEIYTYCCDFDAY